MSNNDNDLFRAFDTEMTSLMDTVMNNYASDNTNNTNNTNNLNDNHPFSFRFNYPLGSTRREPPVTPINTNPSRTTTEDRRQPDSYINTQYYSVLMNSIQTIRDLAMGYNNNIREYNSNIALFISLIRALNQQLNSNINNERNQTRRGMFSPMETQVPSPPRTQRNPSLLNIGRGQGGTFYRTNSGNFNNEGSPRNENFGLDLLLRALNLPVDFENVVVSPTPEQIDNASEIITYTSDMSNNYSTRCPITLEDFQEGDNVRRIHHCNHIFGTTAFDNWFERNVRCPVCRFDIRDHSNNDDNSYTERQNSADSVTSETSSSSNTQERGSDEEVTTSRIDMSGNRIRYIIEYEMPGADYILYVPDASNVNQPTNRNA
jgi:uncharacterized Zn finger protein (UPF0148 family)